MTIIVKTQKELDALPLKFDMFAYIEIRSATGIWIDVTKLYNNAQVTACGSSQVTAYDSSQVRACGSSQVRAHGSSQVRAYDSSQVTAYDSSQVRAYDSSQVRAYDSSQVTAHDSSQVRAYDSSQVTAYDSSQVRACGSSQVTACGSSQVRAYGSSQVRAYDSSQVTAYDSSQVRAYGNSMVAVLAETVTINKIADYAIVALDGVKIKLPKKARTATVIKRKLVEHNIKSLIDIYNLEVVDDSVVLFKSVNPTDGCDYTTGTIEYKGTVKCPDFDPNPLRECGGGLHLSPTAGDALSYHEGRVLRCKVKLKNIVVYGKCIRKVRCSEVEVLGELNPKVK
jgi:hypothetical protein